MSRQRKYIMTGIVAICACGMIGFLLYEMFFSSSKGAITFKEENSILEYGSDVSSESLVEEVDGTITSYPTIDSMMIGKQELIYVVSKDEKEQEVKKLIEIMDTQAPIIRFTQDRVTIKLGSKVDFVSYIKKVSDPVDGDLTLVASGEKENSYWIEHDVDNQKVGTYSINVTAMDKSGLKSKSSLTVEVVEDLSSTTSQEEEIEPTYIKGILLVNKQYGLPKDFGGLDETASSALFQLQAGASVAGFDMPMLSGYRSYDYQVGLYNQYVERDGQEAADRYSARPGYSEHQTGLCFDVGAIDDAYGETQAGIWLAQHAADYGFILRFPQGKEYITGYMYEPWHIRYVGVDVAKEIYAANVTLEEYLGVEK